MMKTTIIISLILCIIEFAVIVIISPMAKPALVLRFLPEDVRKKAEGHPEPPKYKQMIAHILTGLFIISFLAGFIFLGVDGLKNGYGYWELAGRFVLSLYIIKIFDIVVQDQLLVMTFGYYKKIFPETADCEGWENRKFNNKNQLFRLIAYPFLCMIFAGIFVLLRPTIFVVGKGEL